MKKRAIIRRHNTMPKKHMIFRCFIASVVTVLLTMLMMLLRADVIFMAAFFGWALFYPIFVIKFHSNDYSGKSELLRSFLFCEIGIVLTSLILLMILYGGINSVEWRLQTGLVYFLFHVLWGSVVNVSKCLTLWVHSQYQISNPKPFITLLPSFLLLTFAILSYPTSVIFQRFVVTSIEGIDALGLIGALICMVFASFQVGCNWKKYQLPFYSIVTYGGVMVLSACLALFDSWKYGVLNSIIMVGMCVFLSLISFLIGLIIFKRCRDQIKHSSV